MKTAIFALVMFAVGCTAQRGSYAGSKPIGYPEIETPLPTSDDLGNRFGEDVATTTIRLPIEVKGDAALYNRLRKLPPDQQPFWLLNWEALEAYRKNPQSYPQKPNDFFDNTNTNTVN